MRKSSRTVVRRSKKKSGKKNDDPFFVLKDDPESKRELLKAALELFVHRGPSEPTVRQIAARAGYSNPAIFKYFPSKDELAIYLFRQCWERVTAELRAAIQPDQSFRDGLIALLEAYANIVEEDLDAFIYARENIRRFCEFLSPKSQKQHPGILLRQLFEKGKRTGEINSDVDIEMLAAAVGGLFSQFSNLLYWGECSRSRSDWLPSMRRVIFKMCE